MSNINDALAAHWGRQLRRKLRSKRPTYQELLDAIQEAATWLDGLCIGHAVADQQRYELAVKLSKLGKRPRKDDK